MGGGPGPAFGPDNILLMAALAGVAGVAALSTLAGLGTGMSAIDMTRMGGAPGWQALGVGVGMFTMPSPPWTPAYAAAMLAMWWLMMLAMMLPSAMPMMLQYAALAPLRGDRRASRLDPYTFALGYGLAWGGFSLAAVLLQWQLSEARLLSPMMLTATRWFAGTLLLGAGLWQLSPVKSQCLTLCRSPVAFLVPRRRQGPLQLGLTHGLYCLGCCWALMLLLFYGGVMNLYWIAGLAVIVLAEKLTPAGQWLAWFFGGGLIVWGVALLMNWI
jgi:predicted metal-binding membrane protein